MKILYIGYKTGVEEYTALKKVYKNVDLINPHESFFFPYIYGELFETYRARRSILFM